MTGNKVSLRHQRPVDVTGPEEVLRILQEKCNQEEEDVNTKILEELDGLRIPGKPGHVSAMEWHRRNAHLGANPEKKMWSVHNEAGG